MNVEEATCRTKNSREYSCYIQSFLKDFQVEDYYISVNFNREADYKVLYVSVILSQIESLFLSIIELLVQEKISFRFAKNEDCAKWIQSGGLGEVHLGKIFIIYLNCSYKYQQVLQQLIAVTDGYRGPVIPSQVRVNDALYTNPSKSVIKYSRSELKSTKRYVYQNRYIVVSALKHNVKGNVYKCMFFNQSLLPVRCVIKEAKYCMWSDIHGRDITDRLKWLSHIHKTFYGVIPVPEIIDQFQVHRDYCLVMEFIKGTTFEHYLNGFYGKRTWKELEVTERVIILDLLLRVLAIVREIHNKGFVHRDITPANFLISESAKIYSIDMELAYDIGGNHLFLPFEGGTPGFMSPEQVKCLCPTFKEDIYAIGALMIVFFTGKSPLQFDFDEFNAPGYGEETILELITRCTCQLPEERPGLSEIISQVSALKTIQCNLTRN